jgi:hypothetical protein
MIGPRRGRAHRHALHLPIPEDSNGLSIITGNLHYRNAYDLAFSRFCGLVNGKNTR